jgi:alkanesulfonate monooxygenase SsuD/methylene tetrahydromethanopterin reductase-like flavin-dependent oxidoreductase (luciferase family)
MTIGYHASHEQFPPATLLGLALRAEQAGFEAVMCSDHFHHGRLRKGSPATAGYGPARWRCRAR